MPGLHLLRAAAALLAAAALAACGGDDGAQADATISQPPLTVAEPTATATTPQTATTPPATATTPAQPPATTATTPDAGGGAPARTQPDAPRAPGGAPAPDDPGAPSRDTGGSAAPRDCGEAIGGFIRGIAASGADCAAATAVANAWFGAVNEGAAPDSAIDANGYACTARMSGERASVTCTGGDGGRIAFVASP